MVGASGNSEGDMHLCGSRGVTAGAHRPRSVCMRWAGQHLTHAELRGWQAAPTQVLNGTGTQTRMHAGQGLEQQSLCIGDRGWETRHAGTTLLHRNTGPAIMQPLMVFCA